MSLDKVLLYCRLCQLKEGVIDIPIDADLQNKIYECTRIKVIDDNADWLPRSLCDECNGMINSFYNYLRKVQEIDAALKAVLSPNISAVDDVKPEKYTCPHCNKPFLEYTNFQLHVETHSSLLCFSCGVTVKDENEQNKHVCDEVTVTEHIKEEFDEGVTSEGNNSENYQQACNEVRTPQDKSAGYSEDLKNNSDKNAVSESENPVPEADDKSKGKFLCKICQARFIIRKDFRMHQKIHIGPLVCKWENCGKVYVTPESFKTHQMLHENKLAFLCTTCGKACATKESLKFHSAIHLEIKSYTCKPCNRGFRCKNLLRRHERMHHEGVRFYCSQCAKAYKSMELLKRHESIHKGAKEHHCEECPKAFYTAAELRNHQRRQHQGVRPHKCEQCFKTFFAKACLRIHMRSHTGEKPYVCQVEGCGKCYTSKGKLGQHVKAKHS